MKKSTYNAIIVIFILVAGATAAIYFVPSIVLSADEKVNSLLKETLLRLVAAAIGVFFTVTTPAKVVLVPKIKKLPKTLLLTLPCFAVALANFPFSALISGSAVVERAELIPLLALECMAIGVFEETFFRSMFQNYIAARFAKKKNCVFITVVLTSVGFSAWHLLNLLSGASLGGTALQLVYTFLLGIMFSYAVIATGDLWLPIAMHAIFDFGGALVPNLGSGEFQDTVFWILTVSVGVACGVYVFIGLLRAQKKVDALNAQSADV